MKKGNYFNDESRGREVNVNRNKIQYNTAVRTPYKQQRKFDPSLIKKSEPKITSVAIDSAEKVIS